MHIFKKIIISFLLVFTLILATAATWIYSQVNSSLPQLDGKQTVFGLTKSATIERDIQGIATIKAKSRADIAVATGFLHAQERFFQMDLLRRNSAGELSSLFGTLALNYDKNIRRHRFRDRARTIVKQLPTDQVELLKAYTRGVNEGLKSLKSAPFEYLLLQQEPVQWREEDTMLAVYSMYIDLQYHDGRRERTLGLMNAILQADVYAFLNPKGSIWDAAIDGSNFEPSMMPTQAWPSASANANANANNESGAIADTLIAQTNNKNPLLSQALNDKYLGDFLPGSNNWAVSGKISSTGSAIVANDMHLNIRVPNIWYRATFEYPTAAGKTVKVTGATLPGTPNIIVGSNGNIAWGFTNSFGDYSDIIVLKTTADNSQYLTPTGYKDFTYHQQMIAVKDDTPVEITIQETQWGPVIGKNHNGESLAYRWVAHDTVAINLDSIDLEQAQNIDQAFDIAARSGIPSQNMMVGDSNGNIGWTIMGPIPTKLGGIGEVPTPWHEGKNGWNGYLAPADYPQVKNPENNRLWTANSRVVGGENLEKLGNGGYAVGARAQQIRDDLLSQDHYNEQQLLAIGLDDRALFLQRWQQFLLHKVLTKQVLAENSDFSEVKTLLNYDQALSASADSVTYRLVRNFRLNVRSSVFSDFNKTLENLDEGYVFSTIRHQIETPLWQLINQQPDNFLLRPENNWQTLFTKALQQTINDMRLSPSNEKQALAQATWGQQNTTQIQHPLSKGVPFIGNWLDMPAHGLSGDSYMPKVQGKAFGASERMVVSPGHEETGIFNMPTSQASHPFSPYYKMGHSDWEQGTASPFLPGKTVYTLTLLSY